MSATLKNGLTSLPFNVTGQTVGQLMDSEFVSEQLSLNGDESVTVNGTPESTDYVPQDGDTVVFSRSGGDKGSL